MGQRHPHEMVLLSCGLPSPVRRHTRPTTDLNRPLNGRVLRAHYHYHYPGGTVAQAKWEEASLPLVWDQGQRTAGIVDDKHPSRNSGLTQPTGWGRARARREGVGTTPSRPEGVVGGGGGGGRGLPAPLSASDVCLQKDNCAENYSITTIGCWDEVRMHCTEVCHYRGGGQRSVA